LAGYIMVHAAPATPGNNKPDMHHQFPLSCIAS